MRAVVAIAAALSGALLVSGANLATDFSETGVVVYAIDGDTVEVKLDIDGSRERVRMLGVDTPERERCYYRQASTYTREQLLNKAVTLRGDKSQRPRDKYNRVLAYIELTDGENYNLGLIQKGYAKAYVTYDGHERQEEFIAAQKQAQAEGVGLWGACRGRIPFNKY